MNTKCIWKEKMRFTSHSGKNSVDMDVQAPLGDDSAMSPKQLVLAGLCGCTAMDVVAMMKKHKQPVDEFFVEAEAVKTEKGYPTVFTKVDLRFEFKGVLDQARVIEAVSLSQTKYCGVSAMLSKAFPISYTIVLNGTEIATGSANFSAV